MAFIANTNQLVTGLTPTMYGLGSGEDLIRDLDADVISLNEDSRAEGVGDTILVPGDPIWTGNSSCEYVQIATDQNGWIAVLEKQSVANTANLHILDTDGTSRANVRLPSSTTSNYGTKNTLGIAQGRVVVGDPYGNGQTGRFHVYDYDGTLLYTKDPTSTQGGTYGSAQFGASVAIGNNRILVGIPLFYAGAYLRGAFALYDYAGNIIDEVKTFALSPGTNQTWNVASTLGNQNNFHAIGNGRIAYSHGQLIYTGPSSPLYSTLVATDVDVMDLDLFPGSYGPYTSWLPFISERYWHRFNDEDIQDYTSAIYGIRYGSVGCGVMALSNKVGDTYIIDLRTNQALGVIQHLDYNSDPISTDMPTSVRYGRIAIGCPEENNYYITSTYTNAGAVYVHDITSDGTQWEAGFNDPQGPTRRGARVLYKFVHPDLDSSYTATASSTQDRKFGDGVAMGNGYVVMSCRPGISGSTEVFCESISTAMTPYDLIDQQSYGH